MQIIYLAFHFKKCKCKCLMQNTRKTPWCQRRPSLDSANAHAHIGLLCSRMALRLIFFTIRITYSECRIYPKYWDTLSTHHTCPKIWNSPFCYPLMYLKCCCMYSKQCRPWSDAAFCGVWSGSTLLTKTYLSQYLGLLRSTPVLSGGYMMSIQRCMTSWR